MASGLSLSIPFAVLIGAAIAGGIARLLWVRPIVSFTPVPRALSTLSGIATIAALVQLGLLTVFMTDSTKVAYAVVPGSAWEVRHSCLTAYFVAGEALARGEDVFASSLYNDPSDRAIGARRPRFMGPFAVDVYEYPPPFLLVPRAFQLVTRDFYRLRPLWFGLCGGFVLFAMIVVARSMGPVVGTRALLFLPLAWVGHAMMDTLQKGNIQLVVIALALLAMVQFERRGWAKGGLMLAYAVASKLYPGMLVLYLLARRQFRAVAWTGALGFALVSLSLWDGGLGPFVSFQEHLPKLLSGEAFPALRNPGPVSANMSVPGLVFKAKLFGIEGMGFPAAKIVGWIFTALILWATYAAARRSLRDDEKPLVWIAILVLATLRSPFLPQPYGVVPPLWALVLLAATYAPTTRTMILVALASISLNLHWPVDGPVSPRLRAGLVTVFALVPTVAIAVLALRRRTGAEGDTLAA
jgi:hypothetical protein